MGFLFWFILFLISWPIVGMVTGIWVHYINKDVVLLEDLFSACMWGYIVLIVGIFIKLHNYSERKVVFDFREGKDEDKRV